MASTRHKYATQLITVYVVIFAVVLFSRISWVRPRENFHFNLCLFIVMKTSENREIKPSRISEPSPKLWKYLYAKIMAYTVSPKSSTVVLWFQHQPTPGNGCFVSLPLQVLRFYRLFGLPQPNLLPQLWRGMKKKKKKRHASGSEAAPQESPPPSPPRKTIEGWEYKYSSSPPPGRLHARWCSKILSSNMPWFIKCILIHWRFI